MTPDTVNTGLYAAEKAIAGYQDIQFYEKLEDGTEIDGVTVEGLLQCSYDRLSELNTRFSCRENALALTKIQEALLWLRERTRERTERGVEGQHVA